MAAAVWPCLVLLLLLQKESFYAICMVVLTVFVCAMASSGLIGWACEFKKFLLWYCEVKKKGF